MTCDKSPRASVTASSTKPFSKGGKKNLDMFSTISSNPLSIYYYIDSARA